MSNESLQVNKKTCSSYIIPSYKDYVRDLHSEVQNAYVSWRAYGKPRDNHMRYDMNITRFLYPRFKCKSYVWLELRNQF